MTWFLYKLLGVSIGDLTFFLVNLLLCWRFYCWWIDDNGILLLMICVYYWSRGASWRAYMLFEIVTCDDYIFSDWVEELLQKNHEKSDVIQSFQLRNYTWITWPYYWVMFTFFTMFTVTWWAQQRAMNAATCKRRDISMLSHYNAIWPI